MRHYKLERDYQAYLIKKLGRLFPGCVVLKNDSGYLQGINDLAVFYGPRYAMLEVKLHEDSEQQPNQEYYVRLFSEWAFGAFIFPENEEEVLSELQQAFQPRRSARVSQS